MWQDNTRKVSVLPGSAGDCGPIMICTCWWRTTVCNCNSMTKRKAIWRKPAAMCPVKFMPLYKLAELYVETGRKEEARGLAKKIMNKKVKIASPVINGIKNKMRKLLNEPDSLNETPQTNKSDMKSEIIPSRQDSFLDSRTLRALLSTWGEAASNIFPFRQAACQSLILE